MNRKPEQKSQDGGLEATALAIGALAGSATAMAASILPYQDILPLANDSLPSKRKYRLLRRQNKMMVRQRLTFATI